jgi:hypothetical protein
MWTRNGKDTLIGFIPGADIDESTGAYVGGLSDATLALQQLGGWSARPALGAYTYPSAGSSENWDFQKAKNCPTPFSYRAFAIPNGKTIADVKSGACDALWQQRAQYMVDNGQGQNGFYMPGYEATGGSFNGSAGQKVDPSTVDSVYLGSYWGQCLGSKNWAYAVSRQVHVMRQVAGWNLWIDLNFSEYERAQKGLEDPYQYITESYQSIGDEFYPQDPYNGQYIASDPTKTTQALAFIKTKVDATMNRAKQLGVPVTFGEAGPMIKNDGHAMGDQPIFVQFMSDYCQDLTNNVAALWLYNGTTSGDTSRCFNYTLSTKTYTKETTKFPLSSQKILDLFDPAKFVNRSTGAQGAIYTQAQLDAAVAAQAALDAQSNNSVALATLQAQYDAVQSQLQSKTIELNEAYAQISKALSDYQKFIGNFQGMLPPTTP